jgi:outer membrane protein OmpA-like peptidoglycan-associated protein
MNRSMGVAIIALAVVGAVVAGWGSTGTPRRDAATAELARVAAARDTAQTALAAARGEVDRLTAAAGAARAEADRQIAKLRQDAEAALMTARAETNKAVAAARVEGERQLAAAQADAGRGAAAMEALRDRLRQCEAAQCTPDAAAPSTDVITADAIAQELASSGSIALYGIEFDTGSATLTAESQASIAEVVKLLKGDARLKLLIVGHTDSQGDFNINREISEKRAQAVVDELVRQGIDARRLTSAGVADLAPVSTNDTEEGRARNRRVELVKR